MDYEKKHNEAMLRAEEAVQKGCLDKDMFDIIFPSEESEDERIRKWLIKEMHRFHDCAIKARCQEDIDKTETALVWLEKQKEKPDTRTADDLQLLGFIYDLLASLDWRENYAMSRDECLRRLNDYRPQKPAEWSEEDELMIKNILFILESYISQSESASSPSLITSYPTYYKEIDWLKSLRPQPSWKPSEELIGCLERLIAFKNPEPEDIKGCEELLEQLKKL